MFAKEWEEELIAEWLYLKGYLVLTNIPIFLREGSGGRAEADIIGIKVKENCQVEIWHIEIGSLTQGKKDIKNIRKKFESIRTEAIKSYVKEYIQGVSDRFKNEVEVYRKTYIATECHRYEELRKELERDGIELVKLGDMVESNESEYSILNTIKQWKLCHGDSKNKKTSLPDNCWLLKVAELFGRVDSYIS